MPSLCFHMCGLGPTTTATLPHLQVLLLDAETTKIVSTVYSQSEILGHEVYLVECLGNDSGEQLAYMKASWMLVYLMFSDSCACI